MPLAGQMIAYMFGIVWLMGLTLYTLYLGRNMRLVNPKIQSEYKDL